MGRIQLSPPSFSNHPSVDTPLDHLPILEKYFSFTHFILNMPLKFPLQFRLPTSSMHKSDTWDSTRLPLQPIHRSWFHPQTFLESTSYLLSFLSQALAALAWMMMPTSLTRLQSDLTILCHPSMPPPALRVKTQLLSPAHCPPSSALGPRLHASASAVPSARYTPPASPFLLPSSLLDFVRKALKSKVTTGKLPLETQMRFMQFWH